MMAMPFLLIAGVGGMIIHKMKKEARHHRATP
jgi:hypothetical protein